MTRRCVHTAGICDRLVCDKEEPQGARKLSEFNRRYQDSVLCPDHAEYFEMPEGTYTPCRHTDALGPNEPIECEVCSMGAMRRAGVI